MSIFQEIKESKIYKNEEALSTEYLPDFLPHRETQIQELANNLNPITKGRKPQNTFIVGAPGIGKTCVTKFVFRELQSFADEKVQIIFINTWDYKTGPALLTKIVVELGYPLPRRGLSKDEIIEKLIEVLRKKNKGVVIGLDEVDQLVRNDDSALYDLLRINQYIDSPLALVMISNYGDIFANVEPRIKSSLDFQELKFKPYTLEEMKNILKKRCEDAFRSGVLQDGVILLCANHAVNRGGDVRIGLDCLRKAAKICEDTGSERIGVEHVKKILNDVKAVKLKILGERLEGVQKNIFNLLKENEEITLTELQNEYSQKFGKIGYDSLKNNLDQLEKTGLIKTRFSRKESRGMKCYIRTVKRKRFKE